MEFGFFAQMHVPPQEMAAKGFAAAEHDRLMREVETAVECEKYNYKYVWASEHHFLQEYSHMSAPESFLAYVAALTERIHLGCAIFNTTPSVNHPARVAERVAMIDQLSKGRFEFCTGRGSSTTEQQGFGIPDQDTTKEMWAETIEMFLPMFTEHRYSHEGKFVSFPERNVLPKPYIAPHPPIWVAAGNPPTFEKAARYGLGVMCFVIGSPEQLKPLCDAYYAAIDDCDPVGGYANPNVGCTTTFICEETREKAVEVACARGGSAYVSQVFRWLDTFPVPEGIPPWPAKIPEPTPEAVYQQIEEGSVVIGTPDDCARAVQRFVDAGFTQLITSPNCGYFQNQDDTMRSMKLFGEEVIPRFDTDPEVSTAKLRREASQQFDIGLPTDVPPSGADTRQ